MPQFRTTHNILRRIDQDELWDTAQMNNDTAFLPPKENWPGDREMDIDDVDIWEILGYKSGGIGVYAAWHPYAEFYMLTTGFDGTQFYEDGAHFNNKLIETYYGPNAQKQVFKRAKQLGIDLQVYKTWIEDDQMWKYVNQK